MANQIKVRRGLECELITLALGEFGYATDTENLYIGGTTGNVNIGAGKDFANLKALGAVGDGITDDTNAIKNAIAYCQDRGLSLYVPDGNYIITSKITVSNNLVIVGNGDSSNIILNADSIIGFEFESSVTISNIKFTSNFTTITAINFDNVENCNVVRCTFTGCYFSIGGVNAVGCNIVNCFITDWKQVGIYLAGTGSKQNLIKGNRVVGSGNIHGIQITQGSLNTVAENTVIGATEFGISAYLESYSKIVNNHVSETILEAINIQDSVGCVAQDNICSWGTNTVDFGMSLYGSVGNTCHHCSFKGNFIEGAGKSGIGIAENVRYSEVESNKIINCNVISEYNHGGIYTYGGADYNRVANNYIVETDGLANMENGIFEDSCDNNIYEDNYIKDCVSPWTTTGLNTIEEGNKPPNWYNIPAIDVASTTGVLATATAYGDFAKNGNMIDFKITATVTDNGTGDEAILVNLPFEQDADGLCIATAREIVVSGLSCVVQLNGANQLIIRNYDNGYPIKANGAVIEISGFYKYNQVI